MNNDKAAFFACYWGQKVLRVSEGAIVEQIVGGGFLDRFTERESTSYLLLTPLSLITDEDAIEVAKLTDKEFDSPVRWGINNVNWMFNPDIDTSTGYSTSTVIRIYQYLQSRGFPLPFRQYSTDDLIAKGWAKVKGGTDGER